MSATTSSTPAGGGGADIFDGGEGDDTLIVVNADISAAKITGVEHSARQLQWRLLVRHAQRAAQLNAFKDVGTIQEGGGLQLSLTTSGTVGANVLGGIAYGSVGAAAGDDTVSLGHATGSWAVYGRAGNDRITTGSGADNLNGDEGNDLLNGGAGDDLLSGGAGLDILNGGDGNDELQGYFEAGDVLDGGAGDDKLFDYSSGATTLRGGVGDDKLYSSAAAALTSSTAGEGDDHTDRCQCRHIRRQDHRRRASARQLQWRLLVRHAQRGAAQCLQGCRHDPGGWRAAAVADHLRHGGSQRPWRDRLW